MLAALVSGLEPAYSEDDLSRFQESRVQIPPKDNNLVLRSIGTFIGSARAFEGAGYRDRGVVRFSVSPAVESQLRFPWGAGVVQYPNSQWLAQRLHENISIKTGPVRPGLILPLFGWLYKVSALTDDARGGNGVGITLEKMPRDKWPKGVTLDPYAYPILRDGYLDLQAAVPSPDVRVSFDSDGKCRIVVYNQYIGSTAKRGIWTVQQSADHPRIAQKGNIVTVRAGRTSRFRIVSLVSPDDKSGIVGWAELRPISPSIIPYGTTTK
ncbi:MAG: hypothetical protein ACI8P0_001116 [Planctomycetaceae bacterium]|jgi:hypothetical protein